ncbi:putative peptidase M16, metalloenzyme, LuxS/M16 peptidase [Dioscorea sansibarensis]
MFTASYYPFFFSKIQHHTGDSRLYGTAAEFASTKISRGFSGGLFSWLTDGTSHQPPQDVMFPDPNPYLENPPRTRITTLENGVRIASTPPPASLYPFTSMGLYVGSGPIYETPVSFGASHLLKNMAFKSTAERSRECIALETEDLKVTAKASREQMVYTCEGFLSYFVPDVAELLIDCVRNPAFLDSEMAEQLPKIKADIGEAANDPHSLLLEALHSAGFSGALANPLLASESSIYKLNNAVLKEFVVENYTAPRMVLAAFGADHGKLVSIVERLLSDLPKVVRPEEPKSVYVGGEYRCQADSSNAHLALAFEVPGGWNREKVSLTLAVLQMLVGGGGSFSVGCLGKEMYSSYRRVLNEFPQIEAFSAFSSVYNNTGLFGIQATSFVEMEHYYVLVLLILYRCLFDGLMVESVVSCNPLCCTKFFTRSGVCVVVVSCANHMSPAFVGKTIDLAARELLALASAGQVNQVELDRAKKLIRSAVLMKLFEEPAIEDIGRQILTFGERKPIGLFLDAIKDITLEDIVSLTKEIISSPLTMASWGDVRYVPSYESVRSRFQL